MQKQKRRRASIGEKLSDAAELPKEITLGLPKITVLAKEEASVENYKGIIEYDDTVVRLYTAVGIITIRGNALSITAITDEDVTVRGDVSAVLLDTSEV